MEIESQTINYIKERVDEIEDKYCLSRYIQLTHAVQLYTLSLSIILKLGTDLQTIVNNGQLTRIFSAMQDSGKFNEETVDELLTMIFNKFEKEQLL